MSFVVKRECLPVIGPTDSFSESRRNPLRRTMNRRNHSPRFHALVALP